MSKREIEPSIQRGIGPGTKHIFSKTDVFDIEIFRRLVVLGLSRELAAEAVRLSKKAGATFLRARSLGSKPQGY